MRTSTSCLKVVILGAPKVGKSAIAVRFLTRRFIGEYSSGTDCTYQTMYQHEDTTHKVEIVDCSSLHWEASRSLILDADAFIIVYSITDRTSLKHAHSILETIHSTRQQPHHHHHHHHHHLTPTVPTPIPTTTTTTTTTSPALLLLGNKTDLQHLRQVSRSDVARLTHHFPACRHSEVSAAESCTAVEGPMQALLAEAAAAAAATKRRMGRVEEVGEGPGDAGQQARRRRKSLLGHVSRRLGRVFRRKSLDELLPRRRSTAASSSRVTAENLNRRSV